MTPIFGAERRRHDLDGRDRPGPLAVAVIGFAIGVCAACSSPDAATSTSPPASSSTPKADGSSNGTTATSPSQASTACDQLQANGRQLAETFQQYEAGQTSRVQLLAAAENLLHAAQNTLAVTGPALRVQVEQVRATTQTLVTTLRASPPPSGSQVKSAAHGVLDAVNELARPCASPSASPKPTATARPVADGPSDVSHNGHRQSVILARLGGHP